jgi:uncharacterized MAPEG superfamily protein
MLLLILLALVLLFAQASLPGYLLTLQVGPKVQMGPRDSLPAPTPMLSRSRNALRNLQETLPAFLTLAVLSLLFKTDAGLAVTGATLWLVARTVYVGCYMLGLSPWRSIVWMIALVGLGIMAFPLLAHVGG